METSNDQADVVPCYIAGQPVTGTDNLQVHDPYTGNVVGTVAMVGQADLDLAIETARHGTPPLTRHQRAMILERAGTLLAERADAFAMLIRRESGLCLRDTKYEVGRAQDVLRFAAIEALQDDGRIFSCDVTAQGKARKIFTTREPVSMITDWDNYDHLSWPSRGTGSSNFGSLTQFQRDRTQPAA